MKQEEVKLNIRRLLDDNKIHASEMIRLNRGVALASDDFESFINNTRGSDVSIKHSTASLEDARNNVNDVRYHYLRIMENCAEIRRLMRQIEKFSQTSEEITAMKTANGLA